MRIIVWAIVLLISLYSANVWGQDDTAPTILELKITPNPTILTKDHVPHEPIVVTGKASEIVNWSIELHQPNGLEVVLPSSLEDLEGSTFTWTWDGFSPTFGGPIMEGVYPLTVYAEDSAGNVAKASAELKVVKEGSTPEEPAEPPKTPQPSELPILDAYVNPETFSPNGDGVDEVVTIRAKANEPVEWFLIIRSASEDTTHRKICCFEGYYLEATWDGQSDKLGKTVPDGKYIIEINAKGEKNEGEKRITVTVNSSPTEPTPAIPPTPQPLPYYPKIISLEAYPEVFSPNGDGINDMLIIEATASEVVEWSVLIEGDAPDARRKIGGIKSDALKVEWDGYSDILNAVVPDGAYVVTVFAHSERGATDKEITVKVVGSSSPAPSPHPLPPSACSELKQTLKDLEESLKDASQGDAAALKEKIEEIRLKLVECEKTPQPTAPRPVIDRCTVLKKKLVVLMEELKDASPEEERIKSDIELVQAELGMCFVEPPKPQRIVETGGDECAEIEKTLLSLGEKLKTATMTNAPQEYVEEIKRESEIYDQKFRKCEATPSIKNPCDEIPLLKDTLERMQEKRAYLEGRVEKGEMVEAELRDYGIDILYVKKRLEQMSFACQQGKPVEESPCARLSKLEVIYREINEKIAGTQGDEAEKLQRKLEKVAAEISVLKEKCKKEDLKEEKVESLADIERVYETKLMAYAESASKEDPVAKLKKIREEKNRLIESFADNASELDLKETTMIKKVKIESGEVSLDDVKVKVPMVKISVKGKEVEIAPLEEVTITQGNMTVKGGIKLEYVNDTLIAAESGKPINVMPSQLKDIVKGEIKEVRIIDEEVPKYIVKKEEKGRLFGILSVTMSQEYEINAEHGTILAEKRPWWSILTY